MWCILMCVVGQWCPTGSLGGDVMYSDVCCRTVMPNWEPGWRCCVVCCSCWSSWRTISLSLYCPLPSTVSTNSCVTHVTLDCARPSPSGHTTSHTSMALHHMAHHIVHHMWHHIVHHMWHHFPQCELQLRQCKVELTGWVVPWHCSVKWCNVTELLVLWCHVDEVSCDAMLLSSHVVVQYFWGVLLCYVTEQSCGAMLLRVVPCTSDVLYGAKLHCCLIVPIY